MAIYHVHCDIIGRTSGGSAVAAAAYRATEKITDRTTGERHDYTRKEKALFSEILTPAESPEWAHVRAELWNRVEEKENRKNSQFCRSFDIALMKEFDLETNKKLIEQWANENYVSRGLAADVAIHGPHEDNNNTHAHVLITTRKLNKDGWTEKDREANDREFLQHVRTSWAEIVNAEFERRGMAERIDERTLEAQGIEREPQQHQGKAATAMTRRGEEPDRKKNKEPEESQEITVTKDELFEALAADEEFMTLYNEREQLVEEAKNQEKKAELQPETVTVLKNVQQPDPENPETAAEDPELEKWIARISQMTPREWSGFMSGEGHPEYFPFQKGEYQKKTEWETDKAQVWWVKEHITELEQLFHTERKKRVKAVNEFLQSNPRPNREPEEYGLFGGKYQTSDGEKYGGDIIQARIHQQEIYGKWNRVYSPLHEASQQAIKEHEDCKRNDFIAVRDDIKNHKKLFELMKKGAEKVIETVKEFAPFKAMREAVQRLRTTKDKELEQFRQEQRRLNSLNKSQEKTHGRGGR